VAAQEKRLVVIFKDITAYRAASHVAQVCIIGTGPAGMAVALQLAHAGIPVVMLEAGSDEITAESQVFYEGKVDGDFYFDLDVTRLRTMGGSSNHWAGWCRVIDAHDFEKRDWIPNSGWPITRRDIEPYFDVTRRMLDLPDFRQNIPISNDIDWIQLIKSPAVRVGEKYRETLETSRLIAVVLNTMASDLTGDGKRISSVNLWCNGAAAGALIADHFVVCTGGLENSRLLLWSNEISSGGVVPNAKALGKYWMEHPQFEPANALLFDVSKIEFDTTDEAFFSPTPAAMERLGIMNFGARLIHSPYHGVKGMIADLACYAPDMSEWVAGGLGAHLRCAAQVYVGWEQAPNESNHISLSPDERDDAGIPRIVLHWKKGELERKTLVEGMRLFGETLAKTDLGRLRFEDWVLNSDAYPQDQEIAGHHHMGGTRMGTDLASSVVDANCKVHGMDNLYIGGSSVFTTSGHANPTTTITALAHRLGAHLGLKLRS
jgi:hypothetical protein